MTTENEQVRIKYVPTGIVFTMPYKNAVETMKTDRGNFEAVDFKFPEEKKVVETTVMEQVVEETTEPQEKPSRADELNKLKAAELAAYCDKYQIAYAKTDKKANLIAKIIEAETITAETTE